MSLLSREQILAAKDLAVIIVAVPEWGAGAEVGVRVMTGAEFDTFNGIVLGIPAGQSFNQRAYICALTMCDEHGGRLFSLEEIDALAEKNGVVLDRIYEAACAVNLLREVDRDAAKKNASPALTDASGSNSLGSSGDAVSASGNVLSMSPNSTSG
jgi:hypothetical protein